MFSICFRKHCDCEDKKENNLLQLTLIIKMLILLARHIVTSTARASSLSLSNYRNTIFNQSACVFCWGCFLKENTMVVVTTPLQNLKLENSNNNIYSIIKHFNTANDMYSINTARPARKTFHDYS